MMFLMIFVAQFFAVFFLVMNSKLLRDDRWKIAMGNSWFISLTQYTVTAVIAASVVAGGAQVPTFLWMALGGSLGCGASHLFYTRWIMKNG